MSVWWWWWYGVSSCVWGNSQGKQPAEAWHSAWLRWLWLHQNRGSDSDRTTWCPAYSGLAQLCWSRASNTIMGVTWTNVNVIMSDIIFIIVIMNIIFHRNCYHDCRSEVCSDSCSTQNSLGLYLFRYIFNAECIA